MSNLGPTTCATKELVFAQDLAERLSWAQSQLVFYDEKLQSVVEEVARYTTIAIRIEDEAIESKKITGVLQIGNVDLMLEGIDGALGVQVNRVSPEFVSLSARRNPHGNRCMSNNPFRNLFIL